jgi:wyosine [tRNA(Phe)-imidazoG37] synthetase (radical SAM superfamily)
VDSGRRSRREPDQVRPAPSRVYGPVPSRRLGASLGVDVVPLKVCPYDCIYCQLGPTRTLTAERAFFFSVEEVLAGVERRMRLWPPPDVITMAGSGEPTLYAGLGALIEGIKRLTDTPVVVLTNGALFHRADVRAEAARADIVLPSLDAGDEATFQLVNRPVPGLTLEQVVDGLAAFHRAYRGEVWLEVMVVAGITDTPEHIRAIARLARRIAPDRIQLNTPVRPTFEERAAPVPASRLAELGRLFSPAAEVIAEWGEGGDQALRRAPESEEVLALLRRRPCTVDDVAAGLGLHPNPVVKTLAGLEHQGEVRRVLSGGRVFWHAVPGAGARLLGRHGKRA